MQNTIIRNATSADSLAITELTAQLGYPADHAAIQKRIDQINSMQDHILLVASMDGTVGGWMQACSCQTLDSGFRVEILGLVVAENSRRSGLGKTLVAAAEQWAASIGADIVIVRSNIKRDESHRFYPAIGSITSKTQVLYRKTITSAACHVAAQPSSPLAR
ncbi:hypothetical protein LBMAG53_02410 [Planctomycetota bacterium]|nr:hypothetical protein LBMAG53_02410 [Planctomycetota bacterium]